MKILESDPIRTGLGYATTPLLVLSPSWLPSKPILLPRLVRFMISEP